MNNNTFSLVLAQELIESDQQFPINFADAWQWLGYSTKQKAKNKLTRNFEKDLDYLTKWLSVPHSNGLTASRTEQIMLTIDCFKSLGMMAGTEQGKLVRKYFIECEKKWELTKQHFPQVAQDVEMIKLDKMLEIERLRIQNKELDNTMLTLHGKQVVLALRGLDQAIVEVEKPILEVIDNRTGDRREGISFTQLNDYVYQQTGVKYKNGTVLKKIIEKESPEIIDLVQRPINQEWILKENIEKAVEIIKRNPKQLLLGE